MTRRKANIRPDLVGELFTDGKSYLELVKCGIEPLATFKDITKPEQGIVTLPISEFANFVQLKPVRPIEKPKQPRADLGKTHKKRVKAEPITAVIGKRKKRPDLIIEEVEDESEIADKKGDNLFIHVPTGLGDDKEYRVNIAGSEAITPQEKGLRFAIETALEKFGGGIPNILSEQEKATIRGILNAGE